ncbi:MAG: acyl carrier protein [Candidatus Pacearchaeota archaeon]
MQKLSETVIINFIKDRILKDKNITINKKTLLFKESILDSMNILDIIGFIEDKIGRKIKDDELIMKNFKDVSSIIEVFSNG